MIISASLSAPYGLLSILFVPVYWNPVRLFSFGAGIEDLIFSFANGGIVWFLVSLLLPYNIDFNINLSKTIKCYMIGSFAGFILCCLLLLTDFKIMTSAVTGIMIFGFILIKVKKNLLPISITGSISFVVLYTIITFLLFLIFPQFILEWNLKNLSGAHFLKIPIEEIIWAASFGAVCPLFMAYSFGVNINPKESH